MKFPAFLLWVAEFVEGTCDMTADDVGAYTRLLCHSWTRGGLPNDPARLARVAGVDVSPEVLAKFYLDPVDGLLKNKRQEEERQIQIERSERQSQKGKLSAAARAAARNRGQAAAQPEGNRGSTAVQPRLVPGSQPVVSCPDSAADPAAEENPHDQPELPIAEVPKSGASAEAQEVSDVNTWVPRLTAVQPRFNPGATGGATETQPHNTTQYKDQQQSKRAHEDFPTMEQVKACASMRCIPDDVAESYWHAREAMGWTKYGEPIHKWESDLQIYWKNYQTNAHKEKLRNANRPNTPSRQSLPQHLDRSKGTANEGFELPPGSVQQL